MPSSEKFLTSYVAHHWAASRGGLDLFRRAARQQRDAEVRTRLARLADAVAEDRAALRSIADGLGAGQARVGQALMSVGETVGRLKPNGTLVKRSPLSDVFELEALIAAVHSKQAGWQGLRVIADDDARLDAPLLDDMIRRADDQLRELSDLHDRVSATLHPRAAQARASR